MHSQKQSADEKHAARRRWLDSHESGYHKSMGNRQIQMIAIGGSIGTGLFLGTGGRLELAGPALALVYLVCGIFSFFILRALGELVLHRPSSGSFVSYAREFLGEKASYVAGWMYFLNWAMTGIVDITAVALYMHYWGTFADVPQWLFALGALGIVATMNMIGVKWFAEMEFWFALIKVSTVIIFIAVGVMMIVGILKGGEHAGWQNWTIGDAPFAGGFSAMIGVAMIVGFSFQGTELIGIAAGESENPGKNIPRAVRQVFWLILLFYIFAILIISLIIPYTDPSLLRNDVKDISVSPFTLVFQHAGLLSAAAVMNAVILTAVLSAGNSGMYASTRMLYTLASEGKAPRIFAKLSKGGVPRNALYATCVVAGLCFLTSMFGNQSVYLWLLNTSGMTGFIAWLGIAISHYRFRRGYMLQGRDLNDLPYRSGFFPLGPIFAFVLCLIITLGQNYQAFLQDKIDWYGVTATYIGIPLFLLIWFGYKLSQGTRVVKYSEMEFPKMDVK